MSAESTYANLSREADAILRHFKDERAAGLPFSSSAIRAMAFLAIVREPLGYAKDAAEVQAELDLLKENFQFQLQQSLRGVRVCDD